MTWNQKVGTAIALCLGIALGSLVHSIRSGSHVAHSPGDDQKQITPGQKASTLQMKYSKSLVQNSASDLARKPCEGSRWTGHPAPPGVTFTGDGGLMEDECPELNPPTGEVCTCLKADNLEGLQTVHSFDSADECNGGDRDANVAAPGNPCSEKCEENGYISALKLKFYDWNFASQAPENKEVLPQLVNEPHGFVFSTCIEQECRCLVIDSTQDAPDDLAFFKTRFSRLKTAYAPTAWGQQTVFISPRQRGPHTGAAYDRDAGFLAGRKRPCYEAEPCVDQDQSLEARTLGTLPEMHGMNAVQHHSTESMAATESMPSISSRDGGDGSADAFAPPGGDAFAPPGSPSISSRGGGGPSISTRGS